MSIDLNELRALSAAEKLQLVEFLWDDLESSSEPLPVPKWVLEEASRRLAEMKADPQSGLSHEEVWQRIRNRNG